MEGHNMDRAVVVLHTNKAARSNVRKLVDVFTRCADYVAVLSHEDVPEAVVSGGRCTSRCIVAPNRCQTQPQLRNWLNKHMKEQGFNGILHVLEDTTVLTKSPVQFMDELECMMDVFEYDVWLSTVCDKCNYVYGKYCPAMTLALDHPELAKLGLGDKLSVTTHSNSQWIAYSLSCAPDQLLQFNESFTVPMFWIIELLARRRNTKQDGQLYWMNAYLTVGSEHGTFMCDSSLSELVNDEREAINREDPVFKSLNVDIHPDYAASDDVAVALHDKLCAAVGIEQ